LEVRFFDPQPAASELPERFPSPFDADAVHPLARRAADELRRDMTFALDGPGGGKMFGVLVVEHAGRIGYLRGFSGMVDGRWTVDGFVPPVFDAGARDAFWPAGERELAELDRQLAELDARAMPVRAELDAMVASDDAERVELRARHRANRDRRHVARAEPGADRHALDQQSRGDAAERDRLDARHAERRAPLDAALRSFDDQRTALEGRRTERSRVLLHQIHATYVLPSARGERRSLGELFAPAEPPGGAGDCVAPKLLGYAFRHGLRPIALAELWLGAPPATGGRHAGVYYPACRGKCGPILAHMLDGVPTTPAPVFGGGPIAADEPRTIFEDDWLVVVDKPVGLLSVPGRGGALRDSVLARLRERYPAATGPLVVHRLDLDTSGVLLVAKDADTHTALQRLFARREIDKRYIAWLDGAVARDGGVIELALRVDLDDRPRQIVDRVHGDPAVTEWRVIERAGARTRVALTPHTGRTHQLRVHAAHPDGIAVPIVGDRLYGRPGERLLLHAEALAFVHPRTGETIVVESPAPF
jgi:tRNA pseudouridine32 synthase/23S rRNA pseudouridine746 synthase